MNCKQIVHNTEILFHNMAVIIVPPHLPLQQPTLATLTIEFGNGTITTATYQAVGDNQEDSTIYMQGGGGISILGDSQVFTGSTRLTINIQYPTPQRLITQYNGPVQIKTNDNLASLEANLYAVGEGPLQDRRLRANLTGKGTILNKCGSKTINFQNSSIRLAILN